MSINLNEISLQIIDLSLNPELDIYVNTTGITFSKKVIETLGYPAHVQFCIASSHSIFAIKVCRICDVKSVPFIKDKAKKNNTLCISNKNLKETITSKMPNYNPNQRYKITGEFDPAHRIMYFDLNSAVISEFQPKATSI